MKRALSSAAILLMPMIVEAASPRGMSELEVGQSGFGGYLKSYAIGIFPKAVEGLPASAQPESSFQLLNAARINAYARPAEAWKLELGYELQPIWQKGSAAKGEAALGSALPLARGASYRVVDLNTEIAGGGRDRDYRLYQNLDRMTAYWRVQQADITIGRQAITFGSARVIQATDVLLPYSFQQLNVEYRIGVDAVRAQIPLSQMGELDIGVVVGDGARANESAAFGRVKASVLETDVSGLVMSFSGARLLGGGLERGLWDLGYVLDFAQVWAEGKERYFRLSQSLDYSFESGLMLFGEYHFNGAGANDPSGYVGRFDRFAYRRGGVFLLGRHYLIPGLAYPITPLLNGRVQVMLNLRDGSVFVSGGIEYGATENLYLDLGVFGGLGESPRLGSGGVALASEFGAYPVQAYAAIRWYY